MPVILQTQPEYTRSRIFLFVIVMYILNYNRVFAEHVGAGWLACPLLVPYALQSMRIRLPRLQRKLVGWGLGLILAYLLSAGVTDNPVQVLVQTAKLTVIFVIVYPIFLTCRENALVAMYAVLSTALLNASLIVLSVAGVPGLMITGGGDRWGTILLNPGGLARAGAAAYIYAVMKFSTSVAPGQAIALLVSAALCVLFDGSRGAAISMVGLTLIAAWFTWRELKSHAKGRTRWVAAFMFASIACVPFALLLMNIGALRVNSRVVHFADFEDSSFSEQLKQNDGLRYDQYRLAAEKITADPLFGTGLRYYDYSGISQDVHNSYLEAWMDLGLFGAVCFTALSLWWVPRIFHAVRAVGALPAGLRPVYYNALGCLIFICAMHLFNPIPIELGDWIIFLAASALIAHLNPQKNPARIPGIRVILAAGEQTWIPADCAGGAGSRAVPRPVG